MESTQHPREQVTVKLYDPVSTGFLLLFFAGFLLLGIWLLYTGNADSGFGVWLMMIAVTFGIILGIRSVVAGPRSLTVNGDQLEIIYPNESLMLHAGQLEKLATRKRSKKGRVSGIVSFEDSAGKRRTISISFKHPGAAAAFAWFERVRESQAEREGR